MAHAKKMFLGKEESTQRERFISSRLWLLRKALKVAKKSRGNKAFPVHTSLEKREFFDFLKKLIEYPIIVFDAPFFPP